MRCSAPLQIGAVDRRDQIVEIMIVLQPVGAAEALPQHPKILFGQKADGDDPLCLRLGEGLKLGHRKGATKRPVNLCPSFRRHAKKIPIPTLLQRRIVVFERQSVLYS